MPADFFHTENNEGKFRLLAYRCIADIEMSALLKNWNILIINADCSIHCF